MTLRPFLGVVLAVLFVLGGALNLMASEPANLAGSDDCCVVMDGKCVPCEGIASTAPTAHFASSRATARTVSATLASAACDGPCVPMTPAGAERVLRPRLAARGPIVRPRRPPWWWAYATPGQAR